MPDPIVLQPIVHGAVAAALAFALTLVADRLVRAVRITLADAGRIALIVFCVATGHTAGIAAGRAGIGLIGGAMTGVLLAAATRHGARAA